MQSKKAVEIKHGFLRDVDGRPHGVVTRLAVRHNDVESVRRAALENHDESFGAHSGVNRAQSRARKKARQRRRADHNQRSVAKEKCVE